VVYEAEQEQPRRTVAVKVIKPGLASPELLRRFDQESHALARLQHPGIAQIYEAGSADAGFGLQPYFAMELVRGHPLRDYAEEHRLNTRQRLQLMARICEAVQHAHQCGLIHRDLKPDNILVDEGGQPKILDFGVARVTDSDVEMTRQTDLGQLVGTLAYMSPEQASGDPLEVDTRSDVYALGVILYELLAGRLPYDLSRRPHEAARTIKEEDPRPLSSISRVYRGDIETIVAKALEKDKARRYAAASGLAADIHRYLNDEPIAARLPSARYQLAKFARRHRAVVAGATAVFVVLCGGIIASTWEAARATRERDRATAAEQRANRERDRALGAERAATMAEARARQEQKSTLAAKQRADTEAATAKAVNDFLENDLLAQASANVQARPGAKPDPDLKVRAVLDRSAARIESKFKGKPLVEASIRNTIGATYLDLGLYTDAERQLRRAFDLRRQALGAEHPDTLTSMDQLAGLYTKQGKDSQAEQVLTRILETRRRVIGTNNVQTMNSMNNLAGVYWVQRKFGQAEPLYVSVLKAQRRFLGDKHPDTLSTMSNLAILYWSEGKYTQSEPLASQVVDLKRRVLGEEHPGTLTSMHNLSLVYYSEGKYAQAEALSSKVVEVQRRVLGEDHRDTQITRGTLAAIYTKQGKFAQAEPLLIKVFELQRHVLGDEHPDTLISMTKLAVLFGYEGKFDQAEQLGSKALELRRRALGDQHPNIVPSQHNLGSIYLAEGKLEQAERLFFTALEARRRQLGEEHPDTLETMYKLAQVYQDQGKEEEAETLYTRVLEIRRRALGPQHPDTADVLVSLARVYLGRQRPTDSARLLRDALTIFQKTPGTWRDYNCQSILGASLARQRKYLEAERYLLSGYEGMTQQKPTTPVVNHVDLVRTGQWIIQLYDDWGRPGQAAQWRGKLQALEVSAAPN
jgi:tetratricopeptide (TPR) repeat protein